MSNKLFMIYTILSETGPFICWFLFGLHALENSPPRLPRSFSLWGNINFGILLQLDQMKTKQYSSINKNAAKAHTQKFKNEITDHESATIPLWRPSYAEFLDSKY